MNRLNEIKEFVEYAQKLKGDEKGEAQLFTDRLFRAFGHSGVIEANGTLEARIKFRNSGRTKFADCLWSPNGRDGVLIEMKKKSIKNLEAHFEQAKDYWLNMEPERDIGPGAQKPRYIILCNFETFRIYDYLNFVDEIPLVKMLDRISAFNFFLVNPSKPLFHMNEIDISKNAAHLIGDISKQLVHEQGEDPEVVQKFLLQCVLALFAEDFELLPAGIFTGLTEECLNQGKSSYDLFGGLFKQMASEKKATGGRFKNVPYFNGGLFDNVEPLELRKESLNTLFEAGKENWKSVQPPVFGALFEGTLNAKERHKFGAHFTSELDILKIVNPLISRPWMKKIEKAKTLGELSNLRDELSTIKILDPSCGCGNFLYVAYREVKRIEMQIIEKVAENFSMKSFDSIGGIASKVSTKNFHGIDILPIATEVAKVTLMLAKELSAHEWNERINVITNTLNFSFEDEALPLENLDDNIVCDDALFCPWPEADVIIGNPPYQSKNKVAEEMGVEYINKVREKYPDVPGRADYCVYWFYRAHNEMKEGDKAGLVGTNTIRQNYSREGGLDYIVNNGGTIINAVSTQVWSGDAAVHVSIVNWIKGSYPGSKMLAFQHGSKTESHHKLEYINSALSLTIDLKHAKVLKANKKPQVCFQGQTHGHKGFLMSSGDAERLLEDNPKYKEVLHPFLIANEMIGNKKSLPKRYVIDFSKEDAFSLTNYPELYQKILDDVYPKMKQNADDEYIKTEKKTGPRQNHFKKWWKFWRARNEAIESISRLSRYIVCGQVTKRPIFEFISPSIHPNAALVVFAFDDDYSFGILQSTVHWEWFIARCSTLTERYRYTSNSVFDSFPWPQRATENQIKKIAKYAAKLRQERRKIMDTYDYSLRDLYRIMEESVNNPVSDIQDKLDEAVMDAYGLKKSDDILSFLLDLNLKLSEQEQNKESIVGPGLPSFIQDQSKYVTNDCVEI